MTGARKARALRWNARTALFAALVLVLTLSGAFAAVPPLRNALVAYWNDPNSLPTSIEDPRVHYEPGAEDYAHAVAMLLPGAIAKVEASQGQPFPGPVRIGVYATDEAFRQANFHGTARVGGSAFMTRVHLAPRLWPEGRGEGTIEKLLTHELAHAHLQQSLGALRYLALPNWFQEGHAVMVSDGGGAERVSVEAARAAITAGRSIVISDRTLMLGNPPQPPELFTPGDLTSYHMIYRQAGLFVADLRDRHPTEFAAFLEHLQRTSFADAFKTSFGETAQEAWDAFAASVRASANKRL